MALPFLDTNVLLRHLLDDVPDQSRRATEYLARIEAGEIQAATSALVVFETAFVLERTYKRPKPQIRAVLMGLIASPNVVLSNKSRVTRAFDLYVEYNISLGDAYHAVLMQSRNLDEIVSFDRDFDRLPGIRRFEP